MPDDSDPTDDLFEQAREDFGDVESIADASLEEAPSPKEIYERNPYAALAAAAGAGYVFGGGLFTPFTKRILNVGMKALVLPVAASKLKQLTQAAPDEELPPEPDE